jgi:hypothetical protein
MEYKQKMGSSETQWTESPALSPSIIPRKKSSSSEEEVKGHHSPGDYGK